jgi:glycosyltransferase involved in cell wall biosynthesis
MKISIAIPCYEMGGWGYNFLQYSLDILKKQNFLDFEVVVSDHSIDNEIKKTCDKNKDLNIKYIKNKKNRGSSSANANSAILNSSGEIIKILCQDDYLYGVDAIKNIVVGFDYKRKWLLSSYLHTQDRKNFINYHLPKFSNKIYLENLVGTHSCLSILNDDPIFFDDNLIWYMDCDYYYRMYKKYNNPVILTEPTVVQFLWSGQVTNTLITDELVKREEEYILNKYREEEFNETK